MSVSQSLERTTDKSPPQPPSSKDTPNEPTGSEITTQLNTKIVRPTHRERERDGDGDGDNGKIGGFPRGGASERASERGNGGGGGGEGGGGGANA